MHNSVAMNQYKQVGTKVAVDVADPHHLIQMLLDGALEKINSAKYHMLQKNIAKKGEDVSKAITIIDGLVTSLDMEKGGEIAENLFSLYDYMQRKLLEANMSNNMDLLDEVAALLNEIKAGWSAIPQEVRKEFSEKNK
ncbi:MAG: flagellar export chaperone FliS [Gammaproteobacteria bacterium]|nr:flagellar export chaperone FliS [Gammaproteobacteria bacterium]